MATIYPLDLVDDLEREQYWSYGHHAPAEFLLAVNRHELAGGLVSALGESGYTHDLVQHIWVVPVLECHDAFETVWLTGSRHDPDAVPVTVLCI
jgi:hypothetical protein